MLGARPLAPLWNWTKKWAYILTLSVSLPFPFTFLSLTFPFSALSPKNPARRSADTLPKVRPGRGAIMKLVQFSYLIWHLLRTILMIFTRNYCPNSE